MFHFDVGLVGLFICEEFGALLAAFEVGLVFLFFCLVLMLTTHNLNSEKVSNIMLSYLSFISQHYP